MGFEELMDHLYKQQRDKMLKEEKEKLLKQDDSHAPNFSRDELNPENEIKQVPIIDKETAFDSHNKGGM